MLNYIIHDLSTSRYELSHIYNLKINHPYKNKKIDFKQIIYPQLDLKYSYAAKNNFKIILEEYNNIIYPVLLHNNKIVNHAFYSDRNYLYEYTQAEGNVLICGLGLGIVPIIISHLDDVQSVTVIEEEQDIIDLIKPYLDQYGKNITIINSKYLEYIPEHKYDNIYFNIITKDNFYNIKNLQYDLITHFKPYIYDELKFALCRLDYTTSIVDYYEFMNYI